MILTRSRRRVGAVFELQNRLIVPGLPASTMPASPQPG